MDMCEPCLAGPASLARQRRSGIAHPRGWELSSASLPSLEFMCGCWLHLSPLPPAPGLLQSEALLPRYLVAGLDIPRPSLGRSSNIAFPDTEKCSLNDLVKFQEFAVGWTTLKLAQTETLLYGASGFLVLL